jgi:hypothetical protein
MDMAGMRKLRKISNAVGVTIPKADLEVDGHVRPDGRPRDREVHVSRIAEDCYLVRVADESGDIPRVDVDRREELAL